MPNTYILSAAVKYVPQFQILLSQRIAEGWDSDSHDFEPLLGLVSLMRPLILPPVKMKHLAELHLTGLQESWVFFP